MFNIQPRKPKRTKAESKAKESLYTTMSKQDTTEDNAKLKEFLEARQHARVRARDKSEVNFWLCLVFQSYEQKVEFLRAIKDSVPTLYGMYADGQTFAERFEVPVTPNDQKPFHSPLHKRLTEQVKSEERERLAKLRKGEGFG